MFGIPDNNFQQNAAFWGGEGVCKVESRKKRSAHNVMRYRKFIQLNKSESIPEQLLTELYKLEINSILIEGGAFTLNSFISAGLWDEARILTGTKELSSGITAPQIDGVLIEEFQILEDTIQILRRKL